MEDPTSPTSTADCVQVRERNASRSRVNGNNVSGADEARVQRSTANIVRKAAEPVRRKLSNDLQLCAHKTDVSIR